MKNEIKSGKSLLDTAINNIPFELHIPTVKNINIYRYYEEILIYSLKNSINSAVPVLI